MHKSQVLYVHASEDFV